MKIAIHTCYDMNHSGWFRHFDRRITPEMLPEAAVPFEERDEELITAVMRLPIKLREVILLFYYDLALYGHCVGWISGWIRLLGTKE